MNCGDSVLIVDDNASVRAALRRVLEVEDYPVSEARNGPEAMDILAAIRVGLVVLDADLPHRSGFELLPTVLAKYPDVQVIVLSGPHAAENSAEETRLGTCHRLEKPVDTERLVSLVRHQVENGNGNRSDRLPGQDVAQYRMVGLSSKMQRVYHFIDCAAAKQSKVLVTGETGTGKSLVARAIHDNSPRASRPFVSLNCAAIPEDLIESELFGHEKGAFTGAHRRHQGKFVQAHRGTLFLDEIGDMSLLMQAKVLRVLDEALVEPVGSEAPIPVDVRLVSATNQNLEAAVDRGDFRMDLFFRINVIAIHLPALRERLEDIPRLSRYFLDIQGQASGELAKRFSLAARRILLAYRWPGNVRELHNVVEKCTVFTPETIIDAHTVQQALAKPGEKNVNDSLATFRDARAAFERDFIVRGLIAHDWQIVKTANDLGIDRTYLWRKMQRYHIAQGRSLN